LSIINQKSTIKILADTCGRPNSCGDGRLGRPSDGEAERPEQQTPLPGTNRPSPRHHSPPVSSPRQSGRSLRGPPGLPQPLGRPHGSLSRDKQPVQRRPRPRQRRILRARAQKRTLPTTQLGIFRKDNFFEVVLDPSPDKREKWILGPTPSCQ
jgi:hypothetical protein